MPWVKGQSGNPKGGPKNPEEIRKLKTEALNNAIEYLCGLLRDREYLKKLHPSDLYRLFEVAFDRFGLPKVTQSQIEQTLQIKAARWMTDDEWRQLYPATGTGGEDTVSTTLPPESNPPGA